MQTKVDLEALKQYYNYQQLLFDRELEQLKFNLTRADTNRLQAEKELLLLQDQAKEKHIWNILDQRSFQPGVVQGDRLFRTAKYAIGHLSESEKRQQILQDYYRSEQAKVSIQQLYQQPEENIEVSQLPSETEMIIPNKKQAVTKSSYEFDQELLAELDQLRQRDAEITRRLYEEREFIKDPEQFKKMLENKSLVALMSEMKNKGDRFIITPNIQGEQRELKKLGSEGDSAQITFVIEQQSEQKSRTQSEQQSGLLEQIENDGESNNRPRTEELLLNESEIPKIPEQAYDFEEDDDTQEDIVDPLDDNIKNLLDNIDQIIKQKPGSNQFERIKQQIRGHTTQQPSNKERQAYFKPINFARKMTPQTPSDNKTPQQKQVKQPPTNMDESNKLDKLIQGLQA